MANTQTTVPTFVDGQVLGAERLNQSAGTGVPVFATTVTRDAGFGGAGEKALAEGQLCYLESTNVVQYYDGAAWATVGPSPAASSGLTFITSGTQSATATASITNIFTSSYTTYKIVLRNMSGSIANQDLRMRLGSSGSADTGANYNTAGAAFSTNTQLIQTAGGTAFYGTPNQPVNASSLWTLDLVAPNVADKTYFNAQGFNTANGNYSSVFTGMLDTSTQYTDFFIFQSSGNIGFSYQVFGYANS